MTVILKVLATFSLCMLLTITAAVLAYLGINGWGWFLFVAAFTIPSTEFILEVTGLKKNDVETERLRKEGDD